MCLKLQLCAGSVRMRLNCMQNKIVFFYKHKIITAKFLSIKPNVIVPNSLW